MVMNALCATAAGFLMGLSLSEIKAGLEAARPGKMRMNIISANNGLTVIDDAYNANPVSVKAALEVLSGVLDTKAAILGDMFELGDFAFDMHYDVGKYAANMGIDIIICIGELSRNTYKGAIDGGCKNSFYFPSQEDFLANGIKLLHFGDTVLVKASRGMQLEKTVAKIQEVEL